MSAAVKASESALSLGKFKAGPTSLTIPKDVTWAEYEAGLEMFGRMARSSPWWIGDLLVAAEGKWGERFAQALECTGLAEGTLRTYKYISGRVRSSIRMDKLSHAHHGLVASCEERDQVKWLQLAATNGWSVSELRDAMRGEDKDEEPVDDELALVFTGIEEYLEGLADDGERLVAVRSLEKRLRDLEKRYRE